MSKAREIPGIDARLPFRDVAAEAVRVRAAEVWEHEPRALDTDDIEGVHDMRVATRRLRAVMEVFAPSFPRKRHARCLREVKALADALGERRDPDVMIDRLRVIEAELAAHDRPGIESLVAELEARQAEANGALAETLAGLHESGLAARLDLLAAEARP